nr:hypothetical protein BHI3_17130 [Bacteriovorax sp. HI3]
MENVENKPLRSLTTPSMDFLLLGGLSLIVWAVMTSMRLLQTEQDAQPQFFQMMLAFSWLSLVCNYPHFLISYRFGYGRGKGFILKNWPSLIGVPVFFLILYIVTFFLFHEQIYTSSFVAGLNSIFSAAGIGYKVGELPNLGIELLGLAVRIMYLTTGWHYSKQAFGCIMVFSHYHDYPISKFQRLIWKISLFSVAIYNFFFVTNLAAQSNGPFAMFFNVPMSKIILPTILETWSLWAVIISGLMVVYFVLYKNFKAGKTPTSAILAPWIALHFWWIPLFGMMDFFYLAVPFFHGLQYLLFAYQLEAPDHNWERIKKMKVMGLKILILFLVGYLSFDYIPRSMDSLFSTDRRFQVMFFFVAIPVFINVHHFFIDSVVWRFNDETIRKKLLD